MKNIFRYLSATISLEILYDGTNENVYPKDFSDSDYASDLNTRCSTIYMLKLASGTITWGSPWQRTVSLSITEAKYIAVCEAVKEALWLKQLLCDSNCQRDKAIVKINNKSAIKLIRNPEFQEK